jgi:hypothetical protein
MLLLSTNYKTELSKALGWLTYALQLAPGKISGHEVCPWRGSCFFTCVYGSGHGQHKRVKGARIRRTKLLFEETTRFEEELRSDLVQLRGIARRRDVKPACRPNAFSDVSWEVVMPWIFKDFPEVQFYDYTKGFDRMEEWAAGEMPANYHLTYSWSEKSPGEAVDLTNRGWNVAVASHTKPDHRHVVNGDEHDLTFLHPPGSLLWLKPKGKAIKNPTAFIPARTDA